MEDLFTHLKELSDNSDFKAELCTRGGFITFSNSGKRGGAKYFQIGLDNIIQTLKDIRTHLDVFEHITEYDEAPWRNNGAHFFNDAVANANSTVQTKPLFSTLSKVIIWANQPDLNEVDPDKHIELSEHSLSVTIEKLEILADCYKPKTLFRNNYTCINNFSYRPYITAIKSKPFLLLAGISGTGKSRIVRELSRACWDEESEEFKAQKPKNFEMIQVKPNWHDSTELLGYVSRVSGQPIYVIGDLLRFITRAWKNLDVPHFLCLDEMNLAPVEQYFAEFLSVIESRKSNEDGTITTDPILRKSTEDWYRVLTAELTGDNEILRNHFLEEGITIPQNLIVVGTVNVDETTFSFSRKVLDRAMTIEMNEVDLYAGLDCKYERIGKLNSDMLISKDVEGVDVYADNEEVCNKVLTYLQAVNNILDGTPFKIAYRTRNEFLLYVVNNLPYNMDENGNNFSENEVVAIALDEITSMKILPRIEGDDTKVKLSLLEGLIVTIETQLLTLTGEEKKIESVSVVKLKEMQERLSSGYTSFWS